MFHAKKWFVGSWLACAVFLALPGCGSRTESTPPASDAVTTEPLDIELPPEPQAAPAGEATPPPAKEAAASEPAGKQKPE